MREGEPYVLYDHSRMVYRKCTPGGQDSTQQIRIKTSPVVAGSFYSNVSEAPGGI